MENIISNLLWVWIGVACIVLAINYFARREKRNRAYGLPQYQNTPPMPDPTTLYRTPINTVRRFDLLQLVADMFDGRGPVYCSNKRGLCSIIHDLLNTGYITEYEAGWLRNYLIKNRPTDAAQYAWWYPPDEYHRRREWLQNHIEKLQKEENEKDEN